MKKRNLILIALAITLVLVFTQIGTMAGGGKCVIVPRGGCPVCDGITGNACHAGGTTCNAPNYWNCCDWAWDACLNDGSRIRDNTDCGSCCP